MIKSPHMITQKLTINATVDFIMFLGENRER